MPQSATARGRHAEELAAHALEVLGYEIITRNWRCPVGEIDLITWQGSDLVFVEVKARSGASFGAPEEAVTAAKQSHLIQAAQAYLAEKDLDVDWRIDVVAVLLAPSGKVERLDLFQNAVIYEE